MRLQYAISCGVLLMMIGSPSSTSSFQMTNSQHHHNNAHHHYQADRVVATLQLFQCMQKFERLQFHQCLYADSSSSSSDPSITSRNDTSGSDNIEKEEVNDEEETSDEVELDLPVDVPELTQEELTLISTIAKTDSSSLDQFLMTNLSKMPSHVVLILRNAAEGNLPSSSSFTEDQKDDLQKVGQALVKIMDENLQSGRDLLKKFLSCGEIRKLDAAIGRAMKENKLDMAFFTVLNMNIRDAAMEQIEEGSTPSLTAEGEISSGDNANRYQILQHIYTRCQEEVEKAVSPGAGLLNKLLRTDQASIRANQLRYYLCPQEPKTISSPDGKSVQLPGTKALVNPNELIEALQNAVRQIRTVEKTGTVDRAAAAGLVESCRQVAIEARLAIGEGYGVDSEELKDFELSLQPVFRPDSAESEYIKGA